MTSQSRRFGHNVKEIAGNTVEIACNAMEIGRNVKETAFNAEEIRFEGIRSASLTLENLKEVIAKHKLPGFTLLVDDGSENKGCVKDFIKTTDLDIELKIAQCDILHSA